MYSYTEEKDNKDRVLARQDSRLRRIELKHREKDFKDRVMARQDSYLFWTEVKTAKKEFDGVKKNRVI